MEKILVTITCANNIEKIDEQTFEEKNIIDVCSLLLTFKPKRGYEPIHYSLDVIETLV